MVITSVLKMRLAQEGVVHRVHRVHKELKARWAFRGCKVSQGLPVLRVCKVWPVQQVQLALEANKGFKA